MTKPLHLKHRMWMQIHFLHVQSNSCVRTFLLVPTIHRCVPQSSLFVLEGDLLVVVLTGNHRRKPVRCLKLELEYLKRHFKPI